MDGAREGRSQEASLVRNLNSLLEVSKALGGEARLDSLLGVIVGKATEVMDAERSSLFIFDEASQTLSIRMSEDVAQGQIRIPLGVGIAGHVAKTREPLNVPDAYADPRFNPKFDRDTGFRTRSILCAPALTNTGKLIGVIQVLNKAGHAAFTPEDERLLLAFASIAGIALDRARLVEAFLEKEKIESSLRLAHDIQMGMLPKRFPQRPEIDLFATLRPAKSVGGDLYDFIEFREQDAFGLRSQTLAIKAIVLPPGQEDFVRQMCEANANTIVVLVANFPVAMPWAAANASTILHMTHASQEQGHALADVLFGVANPGGKTTQTWPASLDQLPAMTAGVRRARKNGTS